MYKEFENNVVIYLNLSCVFGTSNVHSYKINICTELKRITNFRGKNVKSYGQFLIDISFFQFPLWKISNKSFSFSRRFHFVSLSNL